MLDWIIKAALSNPKTDKLVSKIVGFLVLVLLARIVGQMLGKL